MSLLNDFNENIITSDDVSEQLEYMTKREKILNRQKSFCGIWLASDGRYKTKVPTADDGKKLIAKPTTGEPNEDGTITICQEETKTYHKDDDFIFLDKTGKRIHDHAINNIIRRLNGVRNEKDAFVIDGRPSGNHSIRRTTISELHEAMVISEDTLKTFAGHKDISTTQKCYIHQTKDITEYAEEFAKVLDS